MGPPIVFGRNHPLDQFHNADHGQFDPMPGLKNPMPIATGLTFSMRTSSEDVIPIIKV